MSRVDDLVRRFDRLAAEGADIKRLSELAAEIDQARTEGPDRTVALIGDRRVPVHRVPHACPVFDKDTSAHKRTVEFIGDRRVSEPCPYCGQMTGKG